MKTRKLISFLFILSVLTVNGQVRQPHSLYFMQTIPQVSQMNPAIQPRANSYVILPLNFNIDASFDIAAKDIVQKQGSNRHLPYEEEFDYKTFRKAIGKNATMLNTEFDLDIFGFGFRSGNNYFRFGISEHITAGFALPSDFFKITEKGLPHGEQLDFSPLRFKSMAYMQVTVGYSYTFNDKLTIGMNVKPTLGQVAVLTDLNTFNLKTNRDEWNVEARGKVNISAPVVKDGDKIFDYKPNDKLYDENDNFDVRYVIDNYLLGFSNPGLALDFGAVYQLNDRLNLSAAINNLGLITWRKDDDLHGRKFNTNFSFEGLEFNLAEDDFDIDINKIIDELFDFEDEDLDDNEKKFTTAMTPNVYLGGQYYLTKATSVGFVSRTAFWNRAVRQSFNLSLYMQPYSFVGFNVGTTYQVKGNAYLGGGFMFLLGPLQIYLLADYIPLTYTPFAIMEKVKDDEGNNVLNADGSVKKEKKVLGEGFPYFDAYPIPERQKSFTYRVGVNLIFGKHGYVNKPMLDKSKSSWN